MNTTYNEYCAKCKPLFQYDLESKYPVINSSASKLATEIKIKTFQKIPYVTVLMVLCTAHHHFLWFPLNE